MDAQDSARCDFRQQSPIDDPAPKSVNFPSAA
jgi:hypothetical protein